MDYTILLNSCLRWRLLYLILQWYSLAYSKQNTYLRLVGFIWCVAISPTWVSHWDVLILGLINTPWVLQFSAAVSPVCTLTAK